MSSASVDSNNVADDKAEELGAQDENKPRVQSALTIENVKTFEEETGSVNVVELLGKTAISSKHSTSKNDVESLPESNHFDIEEPLEYAIPDVPEQQIFDLLSDRHITKGHKFTGEEYVAISVVVQTDESWIGGTGYWVDIVQSADKNQTQTKYGDKKEYSTASDNENLIGKTQNSAFEKSFNDMEAEFRDEEMLSPMIKTEDNTFLEFKESDSIYDSSDSRYAVNSIGPPQILKYKPESTLTQFDYKTVQAKFPDINDLKSLPDDKQEYYSEMLDEMKELTNIKSQDQHSELINILPHAAYGSHPDPKIAKEHAAERSRLRELEKQKHSTSGYAGNNQTNFYAFARQLKTVNYALSSEKCMEEGWTVRPVTPEPSVDKDEADLLKDITASILSGKKYNQKFVFKQFSNGNPFLAVFPDGTGNVWYSSGKPAISIIAAEKTGKLTFIAQEDRAVQDSLPNIIGVFSANGNCSCYHSNGSLLLLLTPLGGEYFNEHGGRLKQWQWRGFKEHVHAPPFQPITFSLTKHMSVRVLSQESIYITFMDQHRTVRFNVGTKLMLHQRNKLPKLDETDSEQAQLNEKVVYVRMILERVNNMMQFPNSPRLKKIKLPGYLLSKNNQELKNRIENVERTLPEIKPIIRRKKIIQRKALKLPKFYARNSSISDMSQEAEEILPLVSVN